MRHPSAVAISTTGDEHRLPLLRRAVENWDRCLRSGDHLFITVDGDAAAVQRVRRLLPYLEDVIFQVGQTLSATMGSREGVAVNKNTGLELMMDRTNARHLFLSDDDTWPLYSQALDKHIDSPLRHSMVCWGAARLDAVNKVYAEWSWPRGVMLYVDRRVVTEVGGMDERFGAGGHEHAEWSMRIHNAGQSPANFCSPPSYAERGIVGTATRAGALWHAEDMRRQGESTADYASRKRSLTTIERGAADWERIHAIMDQRKGDGSYVPFRAIDNGRASATLSSNLTSQGADT
jgi:hypothetical protein